MDNENNNLEPPVEVKSISTPANEPAPANLNPTPPPPSSVEAPLPVEAPPTEAPPAPSLETPPPTVEAQPPATPPPATPPPTTNAIIQENFKPPRSVKHFAKIFGLAFLIVFILSTLLAVVTEAGFIGTGVDRLYGRTKLATLWGGIPANNELALTLLVSNPIEKPKSFSGSLTLEMTGEVRPTLPSINPNLQEVELEETDASTEPLLFNSMPITDNQPFALLNFAQIDNTLSIEPLPEESPAIPESYTLDTRFSIEMASLNNYETLKVSLGLTDEGYLKQEYGITDISTEVILKERVLYFKVPENLTQETAGIFGVDASMAGKYFKFEIPQEEWDSFQESVNDPENSNLFAQYSEDDIAEVVKIMAKYIKRVGIERVNGRPAVHYKIEMDLAKMEEFAKEMQATFDETEGIDGEVSPTQDIWKEGLKSINFSYDFWIEYKTYLTVKTDFHIDIDSETLTLNSDLSSANQSMKADSVTIDAPDASALINTESIVGQGAGQARDSARKSDLAQIATLLEIYASQNETYPVSVNPIALDEAALLSDVYSASDFIALNGPNGADDDYFYQTNADGSAYILSATLEVCTDSCTYTYPEGSSLLGAETQTQSQVDLATTKGRDQKRKDDLSAIGDALTIYQKENGSYPVANKLIRLSDAGNVVETQIKEILSPLPNDPTADKYYYGYSSTGSTAILTAVMEDPNETNCTISGNFCVYQYKLGN